MSLENQLDRTFAKIRAETRPALIPYLTAGYPNPDLFVELALEVLDAGADMLEIGVPFSDPLLDGPVIQRAQQQALQLGVSPETCLQYVAAICARTDKPLLLMGAYNPIFTYGVERFCQDASAAGISGLIIPDLPLEEQEDVQRAAGANRVHVIQLIAPTSTPERMRRVCDVASGFVYCISVAGVTGTRATVTDTARPLVAAVRECTDTPVAVGFGIANAESAREVGSFADGVIVGSALVRAITEATGDGILTAARNFVSELRSGLEVHSADEPSGFHEYGSSREGSG